MPRFRVIKEIEVEARTAVDAAQVFFETFEIEPLVVGSTVKVAEFGKAGWQNIVVYPYRSPEGSDEEG